MLTDIDIDLATSTAYELGVLFQHALHQSGVVANTAPPHPTEEPNAHAVAFAAFLVQDSRISLAHRISALRVETSIITDRLAEAKSQLHHAVHTGVIHDIMDVYTNNDVDGYDEMDDLKGDARRLRKTAGLLSKDDRNEATKSLLHDCAPEAIIARAQSRLAPMNSMLDQVQSAPVRLKL